MVKPTNVAAWYDDQEVMVGISKQVVYIRIADVAVKGVGYLLSIFVFRGQK